MSVKFRNRGRFYVGVAVVCAMVLPVVADAQDAPTERIGAIERQMRTLQSEHERVRRVPFRPSCSVSRANSVRQGGSCANHKPKRNAI